MTREERLELLKQIEKDISVCSIESTFLEEAKSCAIHSAIEELEQEPKTGHWIIIDDCEKFIAKCSKCGRIEDSRMISKYPYCHCGAKMESEVKE